MYVYIYIYTWERVQSICILYAWHLQYVLAEIDSKINGNTLVDLIENKHRNYIPNGRISIECEKQRDT